MKSIASTVLGTFAVCLALIGCASDEGERIETTAEALRQCADVVVEGIDVSHHNGAIDWPRVKAAGVAFAFMKATQGTSFVSSTFDVNWRESKQAGVLPSAYHFFDPTQDGVAQAEHFLSVMGPLRPGDLPPMLDIECPDGNPTCLGPSGSGAASPSVIQRRALDWLETVERATGLRPLVYTFYSYFVSNRVDPQPFLRYPLFIASLSSTSCFNVPAPWPSATFWQYDWHGQVPGIGPEVDLDRFIGSMGELLALTKRVPPSAPFEPSSAIVGAAD